MRLNEKDVLLLINRLNQEELRSLWDEYVWKDLHDEQDDYALRIEEMEYVDLFDETSRVNPFDTGAPYFFVDEYYEISSVSDVRECIGERFDDLAEWVCEYPEYVESVDLSDLLAPWFKAEAFYTGGGIWLSAKYLDETQYAVIDSESPELLNIYNNSEEDKNIDDSDFPCYDLDRSVSVEDMNREEREIWEDLFAELNKTMC